MSIKEQFDDKKALEVLLYIAENTTDLYHALKVLYFADKEHLGKYGRLICGDSYYAMRLGPVPSGVYDLFKCVRGDGYCSIESLAKEAFSVLQEYEIVPHRAANREFLSDSDIECLNNSIKQYGTLSFQKLLHLSHEDEAFKKASRDDCIALETIISTLPDGELLLEYLQDA